jgi:hypothetical protein
LLPRVDLVSTRCLLYPQVFRMKYAWSTGLGGSCNSRGTRSQNSGQQHLLFGDQSAERVGKRTVGRHAGILGQWGPVVMEGNNEGDASSYSFIPLCKRREHQLSQIPGKRKPCRKPWFSVSVDGRSVEPGSYSWPRVNLSTLCSSVCIWTACLRPPAKSS